MIRTTLPDPFTIKASRAGKPPASKQAMICAYTYTGLDETGNAISKHILARMYATDLKDWETAINTYLKKAITVL